MQREISRRGTQLTWQTRANNFTWQTRENITFGLSNLLIILLKTWKEIKHKIILITENNYPLTNAPDALKFKDKCKFSDLDTYTLEIKRSTSKLLNDPAANNKFELFYGIIHIFSFTGYNYRTKDF